MTGQWIFIQAHDVWMFRDNKPFAAGANFVARSQFPPNPRTMQGIIRTHYLESQGVNWRKYAAGTADPKLYEMVGYPLIEGKFDKPSLGQLQIVGPFVAYKKEENKQIHIERLFPAPLDLRYDKQDKQYISLQVMPQTGLHTEVEDCPNWQPLMTPTSEPERYSTVSDWLTQTQFVAYLKQQEFTDVPRQEIFEPEERIGLGLDYGRRAAAESLLYHAQFVRPKDDIGLLMYLNQPLFNGSGILGMGGEGRSGHYEVLKNFTSSATPYLPEGLDISARRIKIVLLTPAYFTDGWQPQNGNWSPWVGKAGQLVSAAIDKPLLISGWDIALKRPRPLRHFVPVGSVYYFENVEQLPNKPFTETPTAPPEHPKDSESPFEAMGFGNYAIGIW
jgi:CRISPR-associated protein Cmr3